MNNDEQEMMEIICKNAEKEFKIFKQIELLKSKEEIFKDNYTIRFFEEIYEFIISGGLEGLSERCRSKCIETMVSKGELFINSLYQFYLQEEYSSLNTWADIDNTIENYCEEERK